MKKKEKEPSLIRKLINIHYEQAKRRRALRILAKQTWSIDFLSELLIRAAKLLDDNIQLSIMNKDGTKLTLTHSQAIKSDRLLDDTDIFNHLDDDAAVDDFISKHGR